MHSRYAYYLLYQSISTRVVLVQKYAYSTSSYAIVSIPSIVCILLASTLWEMSLRWILNHLFSRAGSTYSS